MQFASEFSNPETTIVLIHIIIIQRSFPLDIENENSYNEAEKTRLINEIECIYNFNRFILLTLIWTYPFLTI